MAVNLCQNYYINPNHALNEHKIPPNSTKPRCTKSLQLKAENYNQLLKNQSHLYPTLDLIGPVDS